MTLKIAIVGAGSIGFTRRLVRDILSVPELADTRFAFQDISKPNLDIVASLCRREIEANGVGATIDATVAREPALSGADYVINTARVGGLEAFRTDVEIPSTGTVWPSRWSATCPSARRRSATTRSRCSAWRPGPP